MFIKVNLNFVYISKVTIFSEIHQLFMAFACSVNNGKVNLKSLPLPCSLSTQILPPCFSTNSLQSINPSPVPVSFSVPFVERTCDILNSFARLSGGIPIPLSETEIVTSPEFCSALIVILPPLFVNFIEFDTRCF